MKKKRRKLKKQISLGVTVFCLIAAGCLALLLTPAFDVKTVSVTGNKTIPTEKIVAGSGIVAGSNIFSVSLRSVKENISTINGVASVKVKRRLPSVISITIREGSPMVYVENNGDYVGLASDGTVIEIIKGNSVPAKEAPAESGEESSAEEANGETAEETDEEADGEAEPAAEEEAMALGAPTVEGMGGMTASVGSKVIFGDSKKAENLSKLIDEFLSDPVCADFTAVDMSLYDNVTMVYKGRLKVKLGSVENLGYKLKCFKAITEEQLDENSYGTLDLERLTYSPKNK